MGLAEAEWVYTTHNIDRFAKYYGTLTSLSSLLFFLFSSFLLKIIITSFFLYLFRFCRRGNQTC